MLKNTVFVCLGCLLLIVNSNCQNQGTGQPSDKIAEYYYYKCYNQTRNLKVFEKLSADFSQFESDLSRAFAAIPDRRKEFCELERYQLNIKFKEITNDLKPCLPPTEQYLPDFIKTSFEEFTHFLCHNNGQHMRILFSDQNKHCRESLENDVAAKLTNCFGRIFKPRSGYLSKQELCDDMSVAEKCFSNVLDEKCTQPNSYKDLSKRFFEYVNKPCAGCISQINIVLLTLSIVLSYLFSRH